MRKIILSIIISITFSYAQAQQLSLSLQQCKEMALKNNEDMKIATLQNQQAKAEKKVALSAYFPNISASATYAYVGGDMKMILPEEIGLNILGYELDLKPYLPEDITMDMGFWAYMFGATAQQPVFAGGKIITANKMAKKGIELSEDNLEMIRMSVIAEAQKAYWTYYLVKDKIKLLEHYVSLLDTLYEHTSGFIEADMTPQTELLKITSRQSSIQYEKQKAKNGLELARMMLCSMIGVDLNTEITLTDSLMEEEVSFPQQIYSLAQRPEYRMLQKQVDMKNLNIRMTRADYLPTLGIMGGYTYTGGIKIEGVEMRMNVPMVMASLNIPIFRFGEGINKIKSAKIARDISQQELEKNSRLLEIEYQQVSRGLQDAFLLISSAEKALEQTSANLNAVKDRYEVRMTNLLDVLDAQTQWQDAYSNWIDAQVSYKIKEIEYLKVIGKLE
jgi:outer membrane protein TolC